LSLAKRESLINTIAAPIAASTTYYDVGDIRYAGVEDSSAEEETIQIKLNKAA